MLVVFHFCAKRQDKIIYIFSALVLVILDAFALFSFGLNIALFLKIIFCFDHFVCDGSECWPAILRIPS